MLRLFSKRAKTVQWKEGAWVVVADTDRNTCSVKIILLYLELSGSSLDMILKSFCFDQLPIASQLKLTNDERVMIIVFQVQRHL